MLERELAASGHDDRTMVDAEQVGREIRVRYGGQGSRRWSLFFPSARYGGNQNRSCNEEEPFHFRLSYSFASTTIIVTSAILRTRLPTRRRRAIRLCFSAASSAMTRTSAKKVSSSPAIAANASSASI